jgi:hypothetical protein
LLPIATREGLETVQEYGLNPEEIRALPDLHFIARNCDSGREMRGRIKT